MFILKTFSQTGTNAKIVKDAKMSAYENFSTINGLKLAFFSIAFKPLIITSLGFSILFIVFSAPKKQKDKKV